MIRLQFVLGHGLSSRAIAWFSAGHFSHVDTVLPDGELLGARADEADGIRGVAIRKPDYEPWKERVVMSLDVGQSQEDAYLKFVLAQRGKPYDKTAIWGFATGRNWREEDSWFCSELCAAGLESAAILPELYTPRNKITPAALALVLSVLSAGVS